MDFNSLGLLILRLGFGSCMAIRHGLPKLLNFSEKMHSFPDPLGIGSTLSLSLAIGAEFFCSVLIILGLFTRAAAIPLMISMSVAFFLIHRDDPFAKKEMALLFITALGAIFAGGAGLYSADAVFRKVK